MNQNNFITFFTALNSQPSDLLLALFFENRSRIQNASFDNIALRPIFCQVWGKNETKKNEKWIFTNIQGRTTSQVRIFGLKRHQKCLIFFHQCIQRERYSTQSHIYSVQTYFGLINVSSTVEWSSEWIEFLLNPGHVASTRSQWSALLTEFMILLQWFKKRLFVTTWKSFFIDNIKKKFPQIRA